MPFINGIGPMELIIILIIALIVVGPGKLPDVGAALGKSIREFRKAATDVKESASLDPIPAATAPAQPAAVAAPVATATPVVAASSSAPPAPPPPPVVAAAAPVVAAAALDAHAAAPVAPPATPAAEAADDGAGWPAGATPVDEQQPTPSA